SPVEHFWALSIQGQFYLIWFVVFTFILFVIRKLDLSNGRKLINTDLGFLFITSLVFSIYYTKVNQPWTYFITFTLVWEFVLGGMLCVNLYYIKLNKDIANIKGWI